MRAWWRRLSRERWGGDSAVGDRARRDGAPSGGRRRVRGLARVACVWLSSFHGSGWRSDASVAGARAYVFASDVGTT